MNDVDDLDDLERELGPTLRVALRRLAGKITDDTPATSPWASDDDLVSQPVEDGVIMVELGHSTRAPTARQRRRPRLNAATIVAAAAVIVVAVVVALSPLDHDTAADQRAAAVAESFMEAWVRGDSQAVAALLSPDAFFDDWTAETLPALRDWHAAMGWHYQDQGCEGMSPQRVWCDYTVANDLTRAFGVDAVAGSFLLIVDGAKVTSVRDDLNIGAYRAMWTAFSEWVRVHHPDDVDRMYSPAAGYARTDPISIARWKRHTAEFIDSGAAYIARARAICAAAREEYDELAAASDGSEAARSGAAARVVREVLTELQTVPAPLAVQASFDVGFSLMYQLVDAFHDVTAARQAPVTTANPPPSPGDGGPIHLLSSIAHLQIGLERCAMNPFSSS